MRCAVPLALAVVLGALAACDSDPDLSGLQRTSPSPSPSPTALASPSTAPTPPASPAATTARPVYWLGATADPRGPRLYREFVRRPAAADPVRDALEVMLGAEPNDPDYTSLWADGTSVRDVTREGDTAVVDLSREAKRNGGGSAFEAMTLQQLVHTVTAADPSVRAVRLLVEGEPIQTLWGSVGTARPLTRASAAETLAPVWLDVQQGGTVDGTFGGTASVFEATVSWSFVRDGTVVQEGFSTASIGGPARGEWTAQADVPPGDYELRAWESSAQDGSVTWLDTKRVTVR